VSSMRCSCKGRDVPEDLCDVSIAVERHGHDDERECEAGGRELRTWPEDPDEREDRGHDERPAEHVMGERRALEEPGVLLVHQEDGARDEESGGHPQTPPAAAELPGDEPELHRRAAHQYLSP